MLEAYGRGKALTIRVARGGWKESQDACVEVCIGEGAGPSAGKGPCQVQARRIFNSVVESV